MSRVTMVKTTTRRTHMLNFYTPRSIKHSGSIPWNACVAFET